MIAPMFWNLCKSSWRKGFLFELFLLLTLLLARYGGCSRVRSLGCGELFEGHSLKDGKEAGLFNKLGRTDDVTKCVEYCCDDRDCKTALFVGKLKACYTVDCRNSDACKPVPAWKTSQKYGMSIFQKAIKGETPKTNGTFSRDDPDRPLIREKRHESCHHYHGTQCTKYLKNKLLYFTQYPPSVERSLIRPLSLLKQRISPTCEQYALAGICYYAFPYCSDRTKPKPTYLCRKDCEQLFAGVCKQEFEAADGLGYGKILPDCETLPSAQPPGNSGCISLNIPDSLQVFPQKPTVPQSTAAILNNTLQEQPNNLETKTAEEKDLNLFKQENYDNKTENKDEKENQNAANTNIMHQNEAGTDTDITTSYTTMPNSNNKATVMEKEEINDKRGDDKDSDTETSNENIGKSSNVQSSKIPDVERGNVAPTRMPTTAMGKEQINYKYSDDKDLNTETSNENFGNSSKSLNENSDNAAPTGTPTSFIRTINKNKISSSDSKVDEKTDLAGLKPSGISEPQVASKESGTTKYDDKNAEISRISSVPTSLPSKPRISKVDEDDEVKKDAIEKIENIKKDHPEPSPTSGTTRRLGLGLQESLGMLEPTNSSLKKSENDAPLPLSKTYRPTFVNVSNADDETNLAVTNSPSKKHESAITNKTTPVPDANVTSSNVSSLSAPTKPVPDQSGSNITTNSSPTSKAATEAPANLTPPPTEAPTLQVSAGDNKVLTLPANSIELYASAFPRESPGNVYTYHWQQISAPQGSHGYMEGKDTKRVILTKLSHVGVYQFKVTVKATKNGAFGFAFVNVTVRPVPRVNKPPRADISPKEQVITLPTNMVVLDGSKSTDDDKITTYKWEEVKGPLNDKNKMISSGADSPVLQLKSLVPGIYTFKLTVVDSDGEKDSTTATVTVNDEKDYPPVARARNGEILTMPINHLTLYGNSSTDDKGIVSYEWSKAPSSPAVGDMQGTNSPILKVSNMVVGDYTFILKVTDTGGQTSSSKVTVVVQPEKNTPPVAKAGSDKDLVYPDDSTTLDAKGSHDDQKIVKYHWDQVSGPSSAEISGADEKIATVKKLQEGRYVFKLTVTDDKGLPGTDTVAVNVKKDVNQSPVAKAGPDVIVHLPNRAAELDGSKSSDDHGIVNYIWYRDPKSPAAGDVINKSNHQAVLRLSNLVEGLYKFKLTVVDGKGLKSSDDALLTVKEDENSAHLVELYLDVDITKFTEENKGQLIRKLAVILDVQDDDIVVEHLKEAGTGHSTMVMFYVRTAGDAKDGQIVAEMLKSKIENEEGFFEFRMLRVEPYICRNNCSFHGYCDRRTKLCVCESFWMQNIFRSSFGVKESNCDWSILYVTVIIFGIVMGIGGIIWAVCFCMGRASRRRRRLLDDKVVSVEPPLLSDSTAAESSGRRGRSRRRHRYAIIDEEDEDDKAERMEMLPKGNYSSMMLTDSDEDSDETTLFEAKKRIPNGMLNGSVGRKAM